jgi:hypothetical protein
MSARIFIFPTFDRGFAAAAVDSRPDLLDARAANDSFIDARDQADSETAEAGWLGLLVIVGAAGFGGGCLFTAGAAWVVGWFL